jgi:hypothetical protein
MNNFLKLLSIFLCLLIDIQAFSQITINNPFYRDYEFKVYSDSSAHTNIKPYNYNYQNDTAKEYITLQTIFNTISGYDIKQKRFNYNYQFGGQIKTKYNKISSIFNVIYSLYKQPQFFDFQIDTLHIAPGYGKCNPFLNMQNIFPKIIGYFNYHPTKYIDFELGSSKFFFGDGYRSLLLSDNSAPFPYFKTSVEVWKVKYIYLIGLQQDFDLQNSSNFSDLSFKYTYTHYLSFNFFKRLNFSMFETVVQNYYDSLGLKRGLELNYLNPVIFYRSVELSQGSPDNVLVGFSGHLKIFKSGMIYGQIFIDEFIFSHIKDINNEWWDEKYGIQAGLKFYNTFKIKNLYSQFEINAVRPYTYSHDNPIGAYTNSMQPLAHPLGANFVEAVGIIGYNYKNFMIQSKIVMSKFGDNDTTNYGRSPIISYLTRPADENILWLQGVSKKLTYAELSFGLKKDIYTGKISLIYRDLQTTQKSDKNILFMLQFGIQLFNDYYDWQ